MYFFQQYILIIQSLSIETQTTFLILGILIILMNIGLMFVHEPIKTDRQEKQRETDKLIQGKLGSYNAITTFIAYISGTIGGPIIIFFKKNGVAIAAGILGFVFLFKIGEAFMGRMSIIFYKIISSNEVTMKLFSHYCMEGYIKIVS